MSQQIPIVFSPKYDITLFGIERMHPFDSAKYGKVFRFLRSNGILNGRNHHRAQPVSDKELLRVHTKKYLKHLTDSQIVAAIAEMRMLKRVPNCILQRRLLLPMRYATGGTMQAARLALDHGWAINLSGGYHHAKGHISSGFCFFADINLAAYQFLDERPDARVMTIDLDAHQGNGFEAVFEDDPRTPTFDMYNGRIYPQDTAAAAFIKYNHPLNPGTSTDAYLHTLKSNLPQAIDAEQPDLIIYNAGVDIYEKDPLGGLGVSAEGIYERDLYVFSEARSRNIPIVMLLSGGYTGESFRIIGESIKRVIAELNLLPLA